MPPLNYEDVLAVLDIQAQAVETRLDGLRGKLRAAEAHRDRLRDQQLDVLKSLAGHRSPNTLVARTHELHHAQLSRRLAAAQSTIAALRHDILNEMQQAKSSLAKRDAFAMVMEQEKRAKHEAGHLPSHFFGKSWDRDQRF